MKKLFGADGIRGIIDHYPFQTEDLNRLGRSMGAWWLGRIQKPTVLVGTDTRESLQRIKVSLVTGLTSQGVDVLDVGVLPTAAISFLVASDPGLSGGVMISASHNPISENGIKVFDQRGMKIGEEHEKIIEDNFLVPSEPIPDISTVGHVQGNASLEYKYTQALIEEFLNVNWRKKKLLIDCAHGASYRVVQTVLSKLGIPHQLQNASPDGTNINEGVGSEKVRLSPCDFADELPDSKAEWGIAFDGDADRVVFVDRDGRFYDGDHLLAILAFELQKEKKLPGETVVITQMANSGLAEHLHSSSLHTKVVRNGDKYISDILVGEDLCLGGEQIGHIILHTDPLHVTGDGLRTALFILAALAKHPEASLYDLTHGMKKWPQVNISAHLDGQRLDSAKVIAGLDERLETLRKQIPDLSRLECRPASTEPVYRIMLEARETPLEVLTSAAYGLARYIQNQLGCSEALVEILNCVNGGRIPPSSVPCFPE